MNSMEADLLELLQTPTPMYSAYRYVTEHHAGLLSLSAFLQMVEDLMERDIVKLGGEPIVDGYYTPFTTLPSDLEKRYAAVALDKTYDPFGYVLWLGVAAPPPGEPEWEVDVDFRARTFVITGREGKVPEDLDAALQLLAPHRFVELRRTLDGERVRIEGVVVQGDG